MKEVIYGRQPVLEVLRSGRREISGLLIGDLKPAKEVDEIKALAEKRGVSISRVSMRDLDERSDGGHHQGVCVEVSGFQPAGEQELVSIAMKKGKDCVFLLLDHIQDPQNTGALIRSAECMGVDAVIIPADRAAQVTSAVVRASAGATEYMKVAVVVNLVRVMKKLKDNGMWFYGLEWADKADVIWSSRFDEATGLVVGSEGGGLSRLVRESCDFLVGIPMSGRTGSLNASASGAVAVYEVLRQKQLLCGKQRE